MLRNNKQSQPQTSSSEPESSTSDSSDSCPSCNEKYNFKLIDTSKLRSLPVPSQISMDERNINVTKQDSQIHPIQNPIVHFIKLSRVLLSCNPSQLAQLLSHIINSFVKHNQFDAIKNILLNGFHKNITNISGQIFEDIHKIDAIVSQLAFNDSFPNDDEDDNQENKKENRDQDRKNTKNKTGYIKSGLLFMPKDLICYNLNFLNIQDIFSISKTCRYLYVIACDPNSIYHININSIIDFNHCSTDIRYSKIKSLTFSESFHKWKQNDLANICKLWKKLESLKVCGNKYIWRYNNKTNNNIFQSIKQYFPSMLNLKRLSLNVIKDCFDTNFITTHINPILLQYLSLQNISISMKRIECLMILSNLKILSFTQIKFNKNKQDFGSLLLRNKKYIGVLYPFSFLKEFKTDSTMINEGYIDVINWILMNGIRRKSLTIILTILFPLQMSKESHSRFVMSLNTINELHIDLQQQNSIYPLTHDMKLYNLNYLKISSTSNLFMGAIQTVIDNIIQNGKPSMVTQFICNVWYDFEWFKKWINLHCNKQNKFFGTVQLNITNDIKLLNTDYDKADYKISNDAKKTIATNIFNEFKAIEWFLNHSDNKNKLKRIGVRKISVHIKHKHKYKVDLNNCDLVCYYENMYQNMNDYDIIEEYQNKKIQTLEKDLNNNAMYISNDYVNQYINDKLNRLSTQKRFKYQQDEDKFLFNFEIDTLVSSSGSDSESKPDSDTDSDTDSDSYNE